MHDRGAHHPLLIPFINLGHFLDHLVMLVLGIQLFLMGLLAEMLVRTYHESQEKRIYAVRERIGFESRES